MNIGNAAPLVPNARAQDITRMLSSLIGSWNGTYEYFDERAGQMVGGPGTLAFRRAPMPNVIMLDAVSERPSGPPVHALTVMVAQEDGASVRQMVFREADGRLQDKIITSYTLDDDRHWTMESIEVQQGLGLASAVDVEFKRAGDHFTVTKRRRFEGGAPAARPYESLAQFDLQPAN